MLKFFLICLIINLNTAYELREMETFIVETRNTVSSIFNKIFDDLKKFFVCKYNSVMHRRNLAKNAFHAFISRSLDKNKTYQCSATAKSKTSDTSTTTGKFSTTSESASTTSTHEGDKNAKLLRENAEEMSITKLVTLHGYRLETHTALTKDGYLLTLHRILLTESRGKEGKQILLHHGLLGSSEDWLLLGPNALPYLLWLSGFDVWLTNARGNKFSRTHTIYSVDSVEFWNFSFHEIGIYDLPAAIDYIREVSDSKSELHFIGYSMGASALLVLLSIFPQYNKILKSAILLAPLAFMYNVRGPIRFLVDFNNAKYNDTEFLGHKEFQANDNFPLKFLYNFCKGDFRLCVNPILLLANSGKDILNANLKKRVIAHSTGRGSAKTIKHYVQLISNGEFQMYDYGPEENLKKYGMKVPPSYRLNDVTLPIAVISSQDDWLSTVLDVVNLIPFFSYPIVHHVIKRYNFGHTDFLWADDAEQLVYDLILDILIQPNSTQQNNVIEAKDLSVNYS